MLGQLQGIVTALTGVVNAPISTGVVRYTAENYNQGYEACAPWWRASVNWLIILLLIIIPGGYLLAEPLSIGVFGSSDFGWLIVVTTCILPIAAIGTAITSVINGQQQFRRFFVLGVIATTLSMVLVLGLIVGGRLNGALLAVALQAGLSGVVMLAASLRQPWFKLRYWWGETEPRHRKAIGGYIIMAITSALAVPISLIMVRNILVENVGWDQAGLWQSVWKVSEVYLSVLTMAFATYYLPRLSSVVGVIAIRREVIKASKVFFPIVVLLAFGIYLFRDVAIYLLFTEEFEEARDLFAIQLIGDVVKILSWIYAYPMISRGATKWYVSTEIFFTAQFVFFAWYFVGVYGTQGANVSYLLNYILYFIFVYFNLKRFSK